MIPRYLLGAARIAAYLAAMFGLIYVGALLDRALGGLLGWSHGREGGGHFVWLIGASFAAGAAALRALGARAGELVGTWLVAELVLCAAVASQRGWTGGLFWDAWLAFSIPLVLWLIGAGLGSAALALRRRASQGRSRAAAATRDLSSANR